MVANVAVAVIHCKREPRQDSEDLDNADAQ